ncbi:Embryo defective 2752 protein [Rhynchospora pubera]|uniref:Embryo defective 2752 protein n=1 Tax=Rhynchospora pubera TaxID=906938 RepID=A0AAV8FX16_9POAL|nr:Embryo defective 2752 protein [Rhynchospora pubera]
MIEPYRRPKSFGPLISICVAAFYTDVVGAAVTEQLYKTFYGTSRLHKPMDITQKHKFLWSCWLEKHSYASVLFE